MGPKHQQLPRGLSCPLRLEARCPGLQCLCYSQGQRGPETFLFLSQGGNLADWPPGWGVRQLWVPGPAPLLPRLEPHPGLERLRQRSPQTACCSLGKNGFHIFKWLGEKSEEKYLALYENYVRFQLQCL